MPVQQTPPKFFITHSWKDIDFTKRLCDDLSVNGLAGFFDAYSIHPGDVVSAEIGRGLEACDIYVPVLSHAALKSPWCEEEVNAAITLGKLPGRNGRPRIIPVLVEDCQDEMPIFLASRLYINFAGRYDDALNELLTKGFGVLSKSPAPPTFPERSAPLQSQPASHASSPMSPEFKPVSKILPTQPTRQHERPSSALPAQPAPSRLAPARSTLATLPRTWIISGCGIAGVLVVCVLIVWAIGQLVGVPTQTPTRIAQATATIVSPTSAPIPTTFPTNIAAPAAKSTSALIFTPTNVPTITPVPPAGIPTSSPTPALGIGTTKISADGATMVYVSAGKFWMGSSDADKQTFDDEKPQHEVDLDAFWIDKFEVTNALYKKCVDAGNCTAPKDRTSYTHSSYYGTSQYDNYPVIYVTFDNATQYCAFAKKQLPTEAQWEKAVRGADKRIYPWGDTFDASKLNSSEGGKGDTTAVGSYSSGASPYGAMDMAGNVWEWVIDWYDANYYKNSPARNPTGPASGQTRVMRGGSWYDHSVDGRAANRYDGNSWYNNVGFRCVE
jgi:formylglycine-generating enzyme required for sulfatase activity